MAQEIDRLRDLAPAAHPDASGQELTPYTPVGDATADKLALYMLARAGYDYEQALQFWKRLATNEPAADGYMHTQLHPHSGYRFSVMAEVTRVIKTKQRHRLPLLP
jgi:predicted Zn-dependent protease